MKLIDREGMHSTTGLAPWKINLLLRVMGVPKLEKAYFKLDDPRGLDLIQAIFDVYRIRMEYDAEKMKAAIPADGAFITVSNHPFGFLDGVSLINIIGRLRPGYKVVANFLLAFFDPIKDMFITVNPFENAGPRRMGGTQKCLEILKSGQGVGLFPAGEVSTWYKDRKGIQDKDWSLSSMKLILQAGVPVIPVYFEGSNSRTFHVMGKVHPVLRTLRLAIEMMKKENSGIRLHAGEAIPFEVIRDMTPDALRIYLREATYALAPVRR
ncbi:MAG: hypothetical protein CMI00_03095 [Oceanospirillaceae bacterium]|nr:hypothetical protein [Oceanospirillaceae bacterium]|tara:strand:- start:52432 stop:53232 length:801 start_codon:yes stop_codon:yes gene_type:complete